MKTILVCVLATIFILALAVAPAALVTAFMHFTGLAYVQTGTNDRDDRLW